MIQPHPLVRQALDSPDEAKAVVLAALVEHGGNRTHTARDLGIGLTTLRHLVRLTDLVPEIERRWPGASKGGGVRGEEHRERLLTSVIAARAARKTAGKRGVSRNRPSPPK